jgi:hypothetical protein
MPTRRRLGPLILISSLTLLAAACGGADGKSGTASATSAAPTTTGAAAAVASPLVGEWRRTQTCEEVLGILTKAGFNKQVVLENIAGNGFLPGVSSPDQIADPEHPCQGAVPQAHSHFFTADGQFGSKDQQGDQVDDGTYKLVDDRTFVVSKEFPDVTFHYQVTGDTIRFDPVMPSCAPGCFEAMWSVMVAFPGETWERVN